MSPSLATPRPVTRSRITFLMPDGSEQRVSVCPGTTVMTAAQQNGVPGILAECGGACTCATCHVYIDASSTAVLPEVGALEEDMLDAVADRRRANSRLSCQIRITSAMDGQLVLRIPEPEIPACTQP